MSTFSAWNIRKTNDYRSVYLSMVANINADEFTCFAHLQFGLQTDWDTVTQLSTYIFKCNNNTLVIKYFLIFFKKYRTYSNNPIWSKHDTRLNTSCYTHWLSTHHFFLISVTRFSSDIRAAQMPSDMFLRRSCSAWKSWTHKNAERHMTEMSFLTRGVKATHIRRRWMPASPNHSATFISRVKTMLTSGPNLAGITWPFLMFLLVCVFL